MKEQPSRRDAFKYLNRSLLLTGATLAGADLAYGLRAGEKAHTITPEIMPKVQRIAFDISQHISQGRPFTPINHNGIEYQPILNPMAVGGTIASLAYIDGGIKEATAVGDYLTKHGLKIGEWPLTGLDAGGAITDFPNSPLSPVSVQLGRNLMEEYLKSKEASIFYPAIHELYHAIQKARIKSDTTFSAFMDKDGWMIGYPLIPMMGYAAGKVVYQKIKPKTVPDSEDTAAYKKYTRRQGIGLIAGIGTGSIAQFLLGKSLWYLINPIELQDFVQIGGFPTNYSGILTDRIPKIYSENIFELKRI